MSGRRVGTLGRLPRPDKKIANDPGRNEVGGNIGSTSRRDS